MALIVVTSDVLGDGLREKRLRRLRRKRPAHLEILDERLKLRINNVKNSITNGNGNYRRDSDCGYKINKIVHDIYLLRFRETMLVKDILNKDQCAAVLTAHIPNKLIFDWRIRLPIIDRRDNVVVILEIMELNPELDPNLAIIRGAHVVLEASQQLVKIGTDLAYE
jgi:hypothetical protein